MKWKYLFGSVFCNAYRLLRVFPNSDPIIGFALPAAKNEKIWKAPLFAFATMFIFDLATGRTGIWTLVTSTTYALVVLLLHFEMKNKKTNIRLFLSRGAFGIILFDAITGPLMGTLLFRQDLAITSIMQIPFTIMHLISGTFAVLLITPFLDADIRKETAQILNAVKNSALSIAKAFT